MSLNVPYERLVATAKVDYIPLKLALNDLYDDGGGGGNDSNNAKQASNEPKIDINTPPMTGYGATTTAAAMPLQQKQMYDALVLGMLTFFCILVLLYAIYYFVILRDSQNPPLRPSYII
ncbi:Ac78 [Peridroma alphabaculovirus]|uniref:Ac78 n=1 Tax=Peridroma alphabaculovirus TaxID=1346829 RepID=A0A0B5E865_9ABAC|nr:Ac78 [Peridroma alphabaculovirus]AJE68928.1 Ac78 [Peridroma alphabaculovirus]